MGLSNPFHQADFSFKSEDVAIEPGQVGYFISSPKERNHVKKPNYQFEKRKKEQDKKNKKAEKADKKSPPVDESSKTEDTEDAALPPIQ